MLDEIGLARRFCIFLLGSFALLGFATSGLAQGLDRSENPAYGSVELQGGFHPDPHVVSMVSGGSVNVAEQGIGGDCRGWAASKPDFKLYYSDARSYLRLSVEATGDTTLVVNAPSGAWYCNDDADDRNPELEFSSPEAGRYDIWVGSYSASDRLSTQLKITERRKGSSSPPPSSPPPPPASSGDRLETGATPGYGSVTLQGGFHPDPHTIDITSGGSVNVASLGLGEECRGYATGSPDYKVHYQNSRGYLRFNVDSPGDTTLVINDPNSGWNCNDDTQGSNPEIAFESAPSGRYDVWVASYSASDRLSARLEVTERRRGSAGGAGGSAGSGGGGGGGFGGGVIPRPAPPPSPQTLQIRNQGVYEVRVEVSGTPDNGYLPTVDSGGQGWNESFQFPGNTRYITVSAWIDTQWPWEEEKVLFRNETFTIRPGSTETLTLTGTYPSPSWSFSGSR